jgi:hypothetical protein
MRVWSPKTEHHEGGESRVIPIFAELKPYLEAAWDLAPEGADHVIARYRDRNANLRTQLERCIRRAGLKPWPKLFQNFCSTRQTELGEPPPLPSLEIEFGPDGRGVEVRRISYPVRIVAPSLI